MVAAVSTTPAATADRPRHDSRVSVAYASTPKNVKVMTPRSSTAAGRIGRAVSVPGGVRRRSGGMPDEQAGGDEDERDGRLRSTG